CQQAPGADPVGERVYQHCPRVPAGDRPGLDPPRHLPARAVPVAPGAGRVIAAFPGAAATAGWLAVAAAGILSAFAAGGAGVLPGCGVLAITGGRARAGVLGVAEQGTGGGQRAVLPDQLGDPGPGHAQPGADLGVGEALPGPLAGLPQPGGAEDRRGGPSVGPGPFVRRAGAGPDPRHLGRLDADGGGGGPAPGA